MSGTRTAELEAYLPILDTANSPYAGLIRLEILKREEAKRKEKSEFLKGIPVNEAKAIARGDMPGDLHDALYSLKKYDPTCVEVEMAKTRLSARCAKVILNYSSRQSVQRRGK